MTTITVRPLRRILGMGFGLALVFGTMVGVGILRLPGTVAAALGDRTLIMLAWALGGLYALMGAVAVAELAAMIPETGGFRVYARRAFGEGVGFAVGWVDWLTNVAALAYVAVTAAAFFGALWEPATAFPRAAAIVILAAFTGVHSIGLRIGSSLTAIISTAIGVMLMILIVGCLLVSPAPAFMGPPLANAAASLPPMSMAMVLAGSFEAGACGRRSWRGDATRFAHARRAARWSAPFNGRGVVNSSTRPPRISARRPVQLLSGAGSAPMFRWRRYARKR